MLSGTSRCLSLVADIAALFSSIVYSLAGYLIVDASGLAIYVTIHPTQCAIFVITTSLLECVKFDQILLHQSTNLSLTLFGQGTPWSSFYKEYRIGTIVLEPRCHDDVTMMATCHDDLTMSS